MMLAVAGAFLIAGMAFFPFDRRSAHYCREQLHRPIWKLALRVTDWAKELPWLIAALFAYLAVQAMMAWIGETPLLRQISRYALALLSRFVVARVILTCLQIF